MIEPPTITATCTGSSSTRTINVTLNSALSAATFFQIDVSGFTNPDSTTTTATFQVKTYNSTGSSLDERLTNIFLTATAGSLTVATITPSDLTVAASNTVNFNITATHKVTAGGSIRVTMPKWNPNASTANQLSMIQGSFI